MKMMKNFTAATIKNNPNFHVRHDLDFTDDGARFYGFDYKGIPITKCKYGNDIFLSIRLDYLDCNYTTDEKWDTDWHTLCDEFNGVAEYDFDKFVENCEIVFKGHNELNKKAEEDAVDYSYLNIIAKNEANKAELAYNVAKESFDWVNCDEYVLKKMHQYMQSIKGYIDNANEFNHKNCCRKALRQYADRYKKDGYIIISTDNFYFKEIELMLNENRKCA